MSNITRTETETKLTPWTEILIESIDRLPTVTLGEFIAQDEFGGREIRFENGTLVPSLKRRTLSLPGGATFDPARVDWTGFPEALADSRARYQKLIEESRQVLAEREAEREALEAKYAARVAEIRAVEVALVVSADTSALFSLMEICERVKEQFRTFSESGLVRIEQGDRVVLYRFNEDGTREQIAASPIRPCFDDD